MNYYNYYCYYIFYTDVCIVILDIIVLWERRQRVYVCMFVVSYVPTIMVMSSCTQPTKCWLQTGISVNFKQYEGFYSWIHATFHKAIKYSNIHSLALLADLWIPFRILLLASNIVANMKKNIEAGKLSFFWKMLWNFSPTFVSRCHLISSFLCARFTTEKSALH